MTNGTVDIIGPAFHNLCGAGYGKCIDLDGSSMDAGILSTSLNLTAGVQYTATFELAGNHRGGADTGTVSFGGLSFGSQSLAFALNATDAFSTYQLVFTPGASGAYSLSIYREGATRQLMGTIPNVQTQNYNCNGKAATGCGWPVAASFTVPIDWPTGVYTVEIPRTSGGNISAFTMPDIEV